MYNNDEILELLKQARNGGDEEYKKLMEAAYEAIKCITYANKRYIELVEIRYESVLEAVHDNIEWCMNKLMNKFDPGKGNPVSYLHNGFIKKVKWDSINHQKRLARDSYKKWCLAKEDYYNDMEDDYVKINEAEYKEEMRWHLFKLIKTLPLNEQDALEGFMQGKKLREIAPEMGCTRQRVHQLKAQAVGKLRNLLKQKTF